MKNEYTVYKMDFKDFNAGPDDQGRRLDRVLRIFLSDKALPEIYKLLRKGLIKLNQKKAKPDSRVCEGDLISIAAFLLESSEKNEAEESKEKSYISKPSASTLKIIFENDHLLIIDKPYDRSVHGKEDGLYKDVLAYLEKTPSKSSSLAFRPGPLHRLDRRTTGLLVFSKSMEGARWFSEGIKNHTISKRYYGLAQGKLSGPETWEDKLTSAPADSQTDGFYTVEESDQGQTAITIASPLAYGSLKGKPVTLVEYAIKTGRKHQIRAQSALHQHPLAGDTAYGAESLKGSGLKNPQREFFLQAFCLAFPKDNPLSLPQEIKIGLSPDFIRLLEYCEIENPGL